MDHREDTVGVDPDMDLDEEDLDLMALEEVDITGEEYHWDRWQQVQVQA